MCHLSKLSKTNVIYDVSGCDFFQSAIKPMLLSMFRPQNPKTPYLWNSMIINIAYFLLDYPLLIEYLILKYLSWMNRLYWNIFIDWKMFILDILISWIFCTETSFLTEYFVLEYPLLTEYFVLKYLNWLNILYWNILVDWIFCVGIFLTDWIFCTEIKVS